MALSRAEIKRRYRARHPERVRAQERTYRAQNPARRRAWDATEKARHPEKRAARIAVMHALQRGELVREPCHICGKRAQAHHPDYSKPLQVEWLCVTHHKEADQRGLSS